MGGLDARSRAELARLAEAGPVLRRRLGAALRGAGKDAAAKAQHGILAAESHHGGELRRQIAGTVEVRSFARRDGAGVEITSRGTRMPPGKGALPALADAGPGHERWRHPVFGDTDVWVSQHWPSAAGWFGRTLRRQAHAITRDLRRTLDQVARDLEG